LKPEKPGKPGKGDKLEQVPIVQNVTADVNVKVVLQPVKLPVNVTQYDITLLSNVTEIGKGDKKDKPAKLDIFDKPDKFDKKEE
jgi:hypothetical protein